MWWERLRYKGITWIFFFDKLQRKYKDSQATFDYHFKNPKKKVWSNFFWMWKTRTIGNPISESNPLLFPGSKEWKTIPSNKKNLDCNVFSEILYPSQTPCLAHQCTRQFVGISTNPLVTYYFSLAQIQENSLHQRLGIWDGFMHFSFC